MAAIVAGLLLSAAMAWWPSGAVAQSTNQRRHILLLFPGENLPSVYDPFVRSFRATVATVASEPPVLFTEYLDTQRFPEAEQQRVMIEFLRAKYAAMRIDLVVAFGPRSLMFLTRNRASVFPSVPVVFAGVGDTYLQTRGLPQATTGVMSRIDPVETVELALTLQPAATSLVVVAGASELDKTWEAAARRELAVFEGRLKTSSLSGRPMPELLREVGRLPRNTIILFLSAFKDGAGNQFASPDVAEQIAARASAPVYGMYDTYMGRGIVGGYVRPFDAMGTEAGSVALRVFAGERPESIPPSTATGTFTVDWRQLQRWDLSEADLPPGAVVAFKEPSLWDRHRKEVAVAATLVLMQSLLIIGLVMQVRRRRRAEESLRASEERYRNVVESQTDLICRYLPDTTLTFVNDAYCRYFNRSRNELLGKKFIEFVPEPARPTSLKRVASLVQKPRTETSEHEVLTSDGTRWQQWVDRVLDPTGRFVELQGVGRDITDLRRAQLEAEERRKEVTHLTRVAIVGELSGALAHELNQPLAAILSNAQAARRLLARDPVDLEEVGSILGDIASDDKRAAEVISRMRALMKKAEARRQPLDVNDLATEVLQLAHSELIQRKIAVITRLAPNLPDIQGDHVQLQQVLLNLIMNACEAMAANDGIERILEVSTGRNGTGSLQIIVADRGPGIPRDLIERIFEPFITTKVQGLGLGLPICRSIVAAHGGRIWVVNNLDRGASFFVSLPIHAARET
jgi:PAS domain S-box-containing protein